MDEHPAAPNSDNIIEWTDWLQICVDDLANSPKRIFDDPAERHRLRRLLEQTMDAAEITIAAHERRINELEECAVLLWRTIDRLDDWGEEPEGGAK